MQNLNKAEQTSSWQCCISSLITGPFGTMSDKRDRHGREEDSSDSESETTESICMNFTVRVRSLKKAIQEAKRKGKKDKTKKKKRRRRKKDKERDRDATRKRSRARSSQARTSRAPTQMREVPTVLSPTKSRSPARTGSNEANAVELHEPKEADSKPTGQSENVVSQPTEIPVRDTDRDTEPPTPAPFGTMDPCDESASRSFLPY